MIGWCVKLGMQCYFWRVFFFWCIIVFFYVFWFVLLYFGKSGWKEWAVGFGVGKVGWL